MPLPFIRQYPNGRRALAEVTCLEDVEGIGRHFIASGGRYVCEILPGGQARLAACLRNDAGEQEDVVVEVTTNDASLAGAVDRLVRASVKHLTGAMN